MKRSSTLVALLAACAACNAIVGYGEFEKTAQNDNGTSGSSGKGDDDDDVTRDSGGSSSSGESGSGSSSSGTSGSTARCDPSKPFAAPTKVEAFDGDKELAFKTRLSTDELEAYWTGDGSSGNTNALRMTRRASIDAPWDGVGTVLLSPKFLLLSSVTKNGSKLYYNPSGSSFETRSSTRPDRQPGTSWTAGVSIVEPDKSDNVFYADSDDIVYLDAPKTTGATERNLFTAPLTGGAISATLTALSITDEAGKDERNPIVNSSETNLYFLRGADPSPEVFHSHRATKGSAWQAPVKEANLTGGDGDNPTWVSEDDCVIYLQRGFFTYTAVRPK